MRVSRSLATLLALGAPLASAWPGWLPEAAALVARADDPSPKPTETPNPTKTTNHDDQNTFNLNTGVVATATDKDSTEKTETATKDGDDKDDDKKKKTTTTSSSKTHHTTYGQTAWPGSVIMVEPATTASSPLYKISDFVTLAWNYSNVLGTPKAVDVIASCSQNNAIYTLTQNMTYATQNRLLWDTNAYQTEAAKSGKPPLLTAQYNLVIYDSEGKPDDPAEPGYLGAFRSLQFGMYLKQSYTPLASGWVCASCSAAPSDMDRRALGFVMTMCAITVLSFTWFVTGLGVRL